MSVEQISFLYPFKFMFTSSVCSSFTCSGSFSLQFLILYYLYCQRLYLLVWTFKTKTQNTCPTFSLLFIVLEVLPHEQFISQVFPAVTDDFLFHLLLISHLWSLQLLLVISYSIFVLTSFNFPNLFLLVLTVLALSFLIFIVVTGRILDAKLCFASHVFSKSIILRH